MMTIENILYDDGSELQLARDIKCAPNLESPPPDALRSSDEI